MVEKDEDLELDQGDQAKKVNEDDLEKAGEVSYAPFRWNDAIVRNHRSRGYYSGNECV